MDKENKKPFIDGLALKKGVNHRPIINMPLFLENNRHS